MPAVIFRVVDAQSYEVLGDVSTEAEITTLLLTSMRYEVKRVPFKGSTVVETLPVSLNVPGA